MNYASVLENEVLVSHRLQVDLLKELEQADLPHRARYDCRKLVVKLSENIVKATGILTKLKEGKPNEV